MGTNPYTEQPTSLEDMEEEVEVVVPSVKEDEGSTPGNDTSGDE